MKSGILEVQRRENQADSDVRRPRLRRHGLAAPVMADGIPDENNLRVVRAVIIEHRGMAGLPIINGVIPVLGHRRRGGQPILNFQVGGAARQ